jgi:hypothetical protein
LVWVVEASEKATVTAGPDARLVELTPEEVGLLATEHVLEAAVGGRYMEQPRERLRRT